MVATTLDRLNGINGGIAIKAPCRVATTANITLSGEQTIDGIAAVADDRVLVKSQTNGVENGVYDVSTGSWSRSLDFDGNRDVVTGTVILVTAGTVNAGTLWRISTTGTITIDATSIAFTAGVVGGAATSLVTPRTIGGVNFDGTANIVPQTIQSINEASDTTCFPLFISASGSQSLQPLNNTALTFNASTVTLGATNLSGTLTTATQTNITSVGTLTGGATGAGFTVALGSSTITGDLALSNIAQGSGLSVLGVTGSSTADFASIAGTANQVLRVNTAGTALVFGGNLENITIGGTTPANGDFTRVNVTSTTIPVSGIYQSAANNTDLSARTLRALNLTNPASAVNYISMAGSATGQPTAIASAGTDSDIAWQLSSKGNGSVIFYSNTNTNAMLQLIAAASSVNFFSMTASATGSNPSLSVAGTDANRDFVTVAKGTGVLVNAGSNTNTTASAVNLNIDASGLIKKNSSSARYKTDIEDMDSDEAQKILELRPIWYRSKCEGDNKDWSYNGFLAEEVAELNPRWALWDYLPDDRLYDENGQMSIKKGANLVPDGIALPGIVSAMISLIQRQEERINNLEKSFGI